MPINTDQVKELLGSGLAISVVASAVGCTDSYITQLMADETFAGEVAVLKLKSLTSTRKRDDSIDDIEDTIIKKLATAVKENAFYKPHDLLRAFAVINNAKRRAATTATPDHLMGTTVINLNIPAPMAQKFTINQQGEVVQVGDQTLVTMSSGQLLNSLTQRTRDAKYIDVRNRIMPEVALPHEPPSS